MDFKFKVGLMVTAQELCLVVNSSYMIESATLLAKSQFYTWRGSTQFDFMLLQVIEAMI